MVIASSRWEFSLALPPQLRYTAGAALVLRPKDSVRRIGKVVNAMCFSPGFVHVAGEAFIRRQLLQCKTCGSQAFHVLDCCRHPYYVKVPTSHLAGQVKAWLGEVQDRLRVWLLQRRQYRNQPVFPEPLDAWEARPITLSTCGDLQTPRQTDLDEAVEEVDHEPLTAHR